jgi:hypothetical protein
MTFDGVFFLVTVGRLANRQKKDYLKRLSLGKSQKCLVISNFEYSITFCKF